ncbi:unnamed protein product [Absidia cylindrospora]
MRSSILHDDSTDSEYLGDESIDTFSVTPTPERLYQVYIVSKGRTRYYKATNPSNKRLKSMEIKCDLGGKNSSKSIGKRLAKSRRIDCPSPLTLNVSAKIHRF